MPYIDSDGRDRLDPLINQLGTFLKGRPPGELDYALTRLGDLWLHSEGRPNFARLAVLNGVLDLVRGEFQRRIVAAYELKKEYLHGDVYATDWL